MQGAFTVFSCLSARSRLLSDDDYIALFEETDGLFIEEQTEEWLIVD
jgi:hypothetical protein